MMVMLVAMINSKIIVHRVVMKMECDCGYADVEKKKKIREKYEQQNKKNYKNKRKKTIRIW